MSYTLGTWDAPADGPLAGTHVEVTRADGKGFTACRVTGPRAAEIRDFVMTDAADLAWRQTAARDFVRGAEMAFDTRLLPKHRTPHVRCVLAGDYVCGARSVQVYGRLRQTRDVIAKALEHFSFHLASTMPGVEVPIIRLTPPASAGPCGVGLGPGEES